MRHWFYLTDSRRRVAIPEADFFPLTEAGVIRSETMVWTEGMEDWAAAGEIHPELFSDARGVAPVDLPTVLQMVRSLSAPIDRASGAFKLTGVLLVTLAVTLAAVAVTATVLAVEHLGGYGWFVLCTLPLASVPAWAAIPLFRATRFSRRAYRQLDRGAFYATSHALGRYAWTGLVVVTFACLLALAAAVLLILYRLEIVEFIRAGMAAVPVG